MESVNQQRKHGLVGPALQIDCQGAAVQPSFGALGSQQPQEQGRDSEKVRRCLTHGPGTGLLVEPPLEPEGFRPGPPEPEGAELNPAPGTPHLLQPQGQRVGSQAVGVEPQRLLRLWLLSTRICGRPAQLHTPFAEGREPHSPTPWPLFKHPMGVRRPEPDHGIGGESIPTGPQGCQQAGEGQAAPHQGQRRVRMGQQQSQIDQLEAEQH